MSEALAEFERQLQAMRGQIDGMKMRIDALTWVVGINAAMTVAVLVRLLAA